MVDDVYLEEEESQECEEEHNKISAGYLSKKITDLAHMEEFIQDATKSDSGLVNQGMPLIQKLRQHSSDSYGQKVNDKQQTFIMGFLNKRRALEAVMEILGEEGDNTVPPLELEDEAAIVIDAYDFVGFAEL